SFNRLPLRITTGRKPACSLPFVGFRSAYQISPCFILAVVSDNLPDLLRQEPTYPHPLKPFYRTGYTRLYPDAPNTGGGLFLLIYSWARTRCAPCPISVAAARQEGYW